MRACSSASGGVMFVADDIERSTERERRELGQSVSIKYDDLLQDEPEAQDMPVKRPFAQRIFSAFTKGRKKDAA